MYKIIIDARETFGDKSVAIYPLLGQPWIFHLLDTIKRANSLNKVIVQLNSDQKDAMEILNQYNHSNQFKITDEDVSEPNSINLDICGVYIAHKLIKKIKNQSNEVGNSYLVTLEDPEDFIIAEEFTYRDAFGHRTPLMRHVYRPLGLGLTRALIGTKISPNMVTSTSLIIIPIATSLIAIGGYASAIIAVLMLQVFLILDVTDGYLARLTKNRSNFGYWYDTILDQIHDISIAISFSIGAVNATQNSGYFIPGSIWIIGFTAITFNSLIKTAAKIETNTKTIETEYIAPSLTRRYGLSFIVHLGRLSRHYFGQPEIVLSVISLGLLFNVKNYVVVVFAIFYGYSLIRMFESEYRKYRRTEIISDDKKCNYP
tara:strand:- start:306 stop:1421 length:1116 start_codon:yes stop_codon:yes gene_type:complete